MISTVKIIAELLLQLLGFLIAQKQVKDAAKEQNDAQTTQNEIDADPTAWFSKHFNAGVQRVTTATSDKSIAPAPTDSSK